MYVDLHITNSPQDRSFAMDLVAIIRRGEWRRSDELADTVVVRPDPAAVLD
jgi:hypothetical protein